MATDTIPAVATELHHVAATIVNQPESSVSTAAAAEIIPTEEAGETTAEAAVAMMVHVEAAVWEAAEIMIPWDHLETMVSSNYFRCKIKA